MILLIGIPSETPLRLVAEALDARGADWRLFSQRDAGRSAGRFVLDERGVTGLLDMPGGALPLEEVDAVYHRMMDDRQLPEVEEVPEGSPLPRHVRGLHECSIAGWKWRRDGWSTGRSRRDRTGPSPTRRNW